MDCYVSNGLGGVGGVVVEWYCVKPVGFGDLFVIRDPIRYLHQTQIGTTVLYGQLSSK